MLDAHRELLEPLAESTVMLQCKDRRRHQHGHLFGIGDGLESGADRHFGLAEAHIAAHEPVHRRARLHIGLHSLRRSLLVGRVLVNERRFQLVLQKAIRRKRKAVARLAPGIKRDQFAGNVLDRLLGVLLHALPCARTQFVNLRRLAVLIFILADAVQRMDVDQQHVVVAVDQFDRLMNLAVLDRTRQAAETSHPMVDMHDIVANFQLIKFLDREAFAAVDPAADLVAVVPVEKLVVGIETIPRGVVDKTGVQRNADRLERHVALAHRVENVTQALDLRLVLGKQAGGIALFAVVADVVGQQFELLVELRLRRGME